MTDKRMTAEERAAKTYVDWSRTPSSGLEVLIANAIRDAEREAKAEAWRKWGKWLGHCANCNCERFVDGEMDDRVVCNCGLDGERCRWEQEQAGKETDDE